MKFTVSILTVVLFLLFSVNDSNAQKENTEQKKQQAQAELQKLQAQIEQIKATDSVDVDIDGDSADSATIQITIKREELVTTTSGNKGITNGTKSKTKKIKFPEIDLSKINVSDEFINERMKAVLSRPMCGTIPGVVISQNGVSGDYIVMENYVYDSGAYRITALKDFVYDRASIPRVFWAIIDKDSLGNVAPLIHDMLYRNGGVLPTGQVSPYRKFSREDTDNIFREIMGRCGVHPLTRELAYQAVRKFGCHPSWKGKSCD